MAKRQSNGAGTYVSRKDGTIEYRVSVGIGMDGKPVKKSFYGKTKKVAREKYDEWKKDSGNIPIEKVKTVGEWADKWLELYKKGKVAYSTYRNYEMYVENRIKPSLGQLRFEQIRPAHIQQFYKQLPEDMSESAKRHINIALNGIFKTAAENRYCTENPVKSMPMPRMDPEEIKVFEKTQIEKMLAAAATHPLGIFILLPMYTGMRVSEITALLWSRVDFDNDQIKVCAAMTRSEGGGYEEGKTKNRKTRYAPMPPELKTAIQKLPITGMYVLTDNSGAPLTVHQYERRYRKFFEETGCDYLSPHKCRHTYATYLLKGGADLRSVQTLLGHCRVNVTEIYTHVDTQDLKNNIKKLGY